MLLISGGISDPNIACLVSTAARLGVDFRIAYAGINKVTWDLGEDLIVDGRKIRPTAVFQRQNVFGYDPQNNPKLLAWYQNWYGLIRAYQVGRKLKGFDADVHTTWNKGLDLLHAQKLGFRIPRTLATDCDIPPDSIYKPMCGGQHTLLAKDKSVFDAGPGFVQEQLTGMEYRIYLAGHDFYAFRMETQSLDYREKQDVEVIEVSPAQFPETDLVGKLAREIGLHYAACDLKNDKDNNLCFLEINSAPMFSEFDRATNGRLSESMVRWLVE